jgi:hypothetical protein
MLATLGEGGKLHIHVRRPGDLSPADPFAPDAAHHRALNYNCNYSI